MAKYKKIVTIGGGSGQYVLLSGLRDIKNIDITAIVSMMDSGGSTGRLRDEFGILPPGDILKCILALSPNRETARKLLLTRFEKHPRLAGHNAGNMLLSILSQYTGKFPAGVDALGEILDVKGNVYPVTIDRATLVAELADGRRIYGEAAIDVPKEGGDRKITNTYLVPHHQNKIKVYPPVIKALKEADHIIIGPGDLYTSIIPNFLVPGVKEAINKSRGKIIYVLNIMTKYGETDNYKAQDFIWKIEEHINRKIDLVLINSKQLHSKILNRYKKQKSYMVRMDSQVDLKGRKIIQKNLLDDPRNVIRHNPTKLKNILKDIIF